MPGTVVTLPWCFPSGKKKQCSPPQQTATQGIHGDPNQAGGVLRPDLVHFPDEILDRDQDRRGNDVRVEHGRGRLGFPSGETDRTKGRERVERLSMNGGERTGERRRRKRKSKDGILDGSGGESQSEGKWKRTTTFVGREASGPVV